MLEFFSIYIAPIFNTVWAMSFVGLFISVVILIVRLIADKKIPPIWKYCMWILVLIALIIPYQPNSKMAFMKIREEWSEITAIGDYNDATKSTVEFTDAYPQTVIEQRPDLTRQYRQLVNQEQTVHTLLLICNVIFPIVWFLGLILLTVYAVFMNIRLNRKILKSQQSLPEKYLQLFEQCKQSLGIKTNIQIILQNHVRFPALIGFYPKVILPEYILDMNDESVKYVFLHELSHYKRGDFFVNYILVALKALYWWNPLTWIMFTFLRQDMEAANDASILRKMNKDAQDAYSYSLVEVLANYSKISFAPKMLCMADDKKNMKRRIHMIQLGEKFKKRRVMISIVSVLLIFAIGVLFLTTGVQPVEAINYNEYFSTEIKQGYILTKNFLYYETDEGIISIRKCFDLENAVIPETIDGKTVTVINSLAFVGARDYVIGNATYGGGYCPQSVYIPKTVTEISDDAFRGAKRLEKIIVDPENPNYSSLDGVLYSKDRTVFIACPGGKTGTLRIPEGVECIGQVSSDHSYISTTAIFGSGSITNVIIPSTLAKKHWSPERGREDISPDDYHSMFEDCSNLANIDVSPNHPSVTSVDGLVYSKDMSTVLYCPPGREGEIRIPDGVKKIASRAFDYAQFEAKIQNIYVPKSVTEIGESAFGEYEWGGNSDQILYITGYEGSEIDHYVRRLPYRENDGIKYSINISFIPIDD